MQENEKNQSLNFVKYCIALGAKIPEKIPDFFEKNIEEKALIFEEFSKEVIEIFSLKA